MSSLPSASVTIQDAPNASASGIDNVVIMAVVPSNADATPRPFASTSALLDFHGYADGVELAAMHLAETGKPVVFCGLPTGTAGAIGSEDDSQVDGTCAITVTGTPLAEADLVLNVLTGGTIGTNGIVFEYSLDGGATYKTVRLGTASSYAIPYSGLTLAFAAGTLLVDDIFTCYASAPDWAAADLATARDNLAAQARGARTFVLVGDCTTAQDASDFLTEVNGYETENDRFVEGRAQVRDHYRAANFSNVGTVTFATAGDTITRSAGSFIADGFRAGDIVISGAVASGGANNGTKTVTTVAATVLTCSTNLTDEGPLAAGSVHITQAAESIPTWLTAVESTFASVDGEERLDLGRGRARKLCPISGWHKRLPVTWAADCREFQHDVQIPTYRKADGPCSGWDLEDEDGNTVEYDARIHGGADAKFTCFRSYANGPGGAFICLSLTRADEDSLLSRTHNMHVVNVAQTVCQKATENAIGQVLTLNSDGTGTEEALSVLEGRVNSALKIALLQPGLEGPRASGAEWSASRSDVLNVPGAILTGTLALLLNGTLEHIETAVKIQTAG